MGAASGVGAARRVNLAHSRGQRGSLPPCVYEEESEVMMKGKGRQDNGYVPLVTGVPLFTGEINTLKEIIICS